MGYKIAWTKDNKHLYMCVGIDEDAKSVAGVRGKLPPFRFPVYSEKELTQAEKDAKVAEFVERILLEQPKPDAKEDWTPHIEAMQTTLKAAANIKGDIQTDIELKVLRDKIVALKPLVEKEAVGGKLN